MLGQRVQFPPGYYIQWAGQFEYLQGAEAAAQDRRPVHAADHFRAHLHEHAIRRENRHRAAGRAVLARGRVLVPLPARLQHERGRVGRPHRARRSRCRNRRRDAALPRSRLGQIPREGRMNSMGDLHAAVIEGAVRRIRPKIMTVCAILFGLLPIMWSPPRKRRRRDETHRRADDRRRHHLRDSGTADLSGDLCDLAQARIARPKRGTNAADSACGSGSARETAFLTFTRKGAI